MDGIISWLMRKKIYRIYVLYIFSRQNIIFKFYKSKRESRNENRLTISFRLASRIETLNETMSNKKTYKNIFPKDQK